MVVLTSRVVGAREKKGSSQNFDLFWGKKGKSRETGGTVSCFFFFGKSFPRHFSVNEKNVFRQNQKPFRCFEFCRKSVFPLTEKCRGETVSRKRKKGKVPPRFLELSLFSLKKVKVLCKLPKIRENFQESSEVQIEKRPWGVGRRHESECTKTLMSDVLAQ